MTAIRKKTEETTTKLRNQGFSVVEIWEHEFVKLKKEDTELQKFLKSHRVQDRLNPRDAFFGGRTNAVKLFHEGDAKYVDFTSLYPWVRLNSITLRFYFGKQPILFVTFSFYFTGQQILQVSCRTSTDHHG